MRSIWSDLLSFLWAYLSHWQSYATGGVVTGIIGVSERLLGKQLPKKVYAAIFILVFSLAAFFLAWRDEYIRANELAKVSIQLQTTTDNLRQQVRGSDEKDAEIKQLRAKLEARTPPESPNSLRRRTLKLVNDLNLFWSRRPQQYRAKVQNPTTDEERQRNAAFDKYWIEAEAAYRNANFRDRLLGIVREYKGKGIASGYLEQGFEQSNRMVGADAFGGSDLEDCFRFMSDICSLRELAYHVDDNDQPIILVLDKQ